MEYDRTALADLARHAMEERGFLTDFPKEALAEAERLDGGIAAGSSVRDLRDLLWCSIDNDETRDLDQLTVADRLPDGTVRVRVAIADVSAFVPPGSAIDRHARHNTTTVYTAGGTFSMIPERLSTGLTSLHEGEDRLSMVVEMCVEEDGSVSGSDLYRALVRNQAKLTYRGIGAWLDNAGPLPARAAEVQGLPDLLKLQDEAARRLRRRRHERGALRLERADMRLVFNDSGAVTGLKLERTNRAKELIEDFMVAANETTARFLEARGLPSLRRVVEAPQRWPRIVDVAFQLGETLPAEPDSLALATFLDRRREADPEGFGELSLTITKLLGSGEYVVDLPEREAPGHFGLAVEDYTHATAPNRRYPDLITQRLLKAALDGRSNGGLYTPEELEELARHCTERENEAQKVERQVRKSAAALLLAGRIGETFGAIVTGASEKGTWVRLLALPVEGRLERGCEGLDVGDRVRVRLAATDVERGFIDFEC